MIGFGAIVAVGALFQTLPGMIAFLVLAFLSANILVHLPLVVIPIWWVSGAGWRWQVAALVPAIPVAAFYVEMLFEPFGILSESAIGSLGPLFFAGCWACFYLIYVGFLIRLSPGPTSPVL